MASLLTVRLLVFFFNNNKKNSTRTHPHGFAGNFLHVATLAKCYFSQRHYPNIISSHNLPVKVFVAAVLID